MSAGQGGTGGDGNGARLGAPGQEQAFLRAVLENAQDGIVGIGRRIQSVTESVHSHVAHLDERGFRFGTAVVGKLEFHQSPALTVLTDSA